MWQEGQENKKHRSPLTTPPPLPWATKVQPLTSTPSLQNLGPAVTRLTSDTHSLTTLRHLTVPPRRLSPFLEVPKGILPNHREWGLSSWLCPCSGSSWFLWEMGFQDAIQPACLSTSFTPAQILSYPGLASEAGEIERYWSPGQRLPNAYILGGFMASLRPSRSLWGRETLSHSRDKETEAKRGWGPYPGT